MATTTTRQKEAARKNIHKAQAVWRGMSKRAHSLAQPEGRERERPGAGGGRFYRVEVRPKSEFVTFRTQDVGVHGHLERLAGKRSSGSWDTQTWLISKDDAHKEGSTLVIDDKKSRAVLTQIRGPITHKKGDVFTALPRKNIPERAKPTSAQQKARAKNIRKAQAVRHKKYM